MIRKWKHKITGEVVKVAVWWEIPPPNEILDSETISKAVRDKKDEWKDRQFKIGALVQVGWLIQNKHGVWLGVGPKGKDVFEDLGDWLEPGK